jgi:hypothetical protein
MSSMRCTLLTAGITSLSNVKSDDSERSARLIVLGREEMAESGRALPRHREPFVVRQCERKP